MNSQPIHRRRRVRKLAAAVLIGASAMVGTAQAAHADYVRFPSDGSLAADLEATCSNSAHTMTVTLSVAPEPNFPAGQYAHYQLWAVDLSVAGAHWQSTPWYGPYWVTHKTYTNNNGFIVVSGSTDLPALHFTGVAGHSYATLAYVEWWNPTLRAWTDRLTVAETTPWELVSYGTGSYAVATAYCTT